MENTKWWVHNLSWLIELDADAMRGLVMDGQLGHKFEKMVEKNSVPVDYDSHPFMKAYREAVGDEDVRVIESEVRGRVHIRLKFDGTSHC